MSRVIASPTKPLRYIYIYILRTWKQQRSKEEREGKEEDSLTLVEEVDLGNVTTKKA